MKINLTPKLNNSQTKYNNFVNDPIQKQKSTNSNINHSALFCQCSFGQAQVNLQKQKEDDIINSLLDENYQIKRSYIRDNVRHIQIGKPIEGWQDLLETVSHITCHYDDNQNLKKIYMQDDKTLETKVFNSLGKLEIDYTPNDIEALKYYKHNPDDIHSFLRDEIEIYSGGWGKATHEAIKQLDEVFKNKTFKIENNITLYRGMDKNIDEIGHIGEIYEDKSFVSTTTELDTAQRFAGSKHPIMEISFPKGSKYIDMDSLFNINMGNWQEQEYLLNRNSKFLITDYDKEKNIIKAEYIGE